ncbi:mucin-16 [Tympanuchus pallidicinctus]|uniref:mucin-16 n=1 Tax=Tympanuchus pallidicinctus TaxID=109042 RepID=UPI002286E215|nr:mucin-16 [Tympanuchus pallidicinctus]
MQDISSQPAETSTAATSSTAITATSALLTSTNAGPTTSTTIFTSPPTRPPTTPPGLERFTVNFTITNLPYDSDLHVPHSAKLNSTQRVMTTLLNRLLKDTSIGPNFLGCATTAFRSLRQGDNTGVDLVCSYRKEPSSPDLDRVGLYHEVSNKTRAVTRLGPYSLDRTSLYVNGYNEQPVTRPVTPTPTRPPTTPPGLERFTVNFTITNLPYDSDLHVPHSAKLNSTQRVMTTLLNRLLKDTSIGPNFLGCATTAFRSLRQGDNTGVDLVCSYRKEPSSPDLDRVGLYHEVSNKTRAVTRLGPYSLDRTSLYVNGYNEQPVTRPVTPTPTRPPTTPPGLERFTVNFTITNLPYDSDLHVPHSAKLNSTQRVMTTLLNRLLKDTSIGPNFLGCATTAFRSLRQGDNTGVDLVCSYRKEPSSPDLDRVGLYHEVSNKTRAVTRLGPYSLDRTSLYVNGYNEQPVTRPVTPTPTRPPTTPPGLERFTVNFTITNLPYDSDLHVPHSAKLNSTQRVMTTLLNRLLKDTSIGPNFLGCATTAFRSLRQGDNTGVDLVCSYRKEPSSPDLDRVGLYHEVSNKTRAVTRLGPYSLDRTSLYVNGYNEQPVTRPVTPTPTRPPTTPPGLERFTVNFTITNLPYDSDLHVPHSAKLNSTQRVMTTLLNRLLKDTSIGPNFLGCATTAFRSLRQGDNTGVDLVCSYRKEPSSPDLDRVGLYHEVSNKTRAVTRLGPYSLDRTSLYVNGYNEQPVTRPVTPTPTRPPTTPPGLERFTVNFTITNLPYDSDLHVPHSAKLNSTQRVMTTLLNRLLKDTSIGPNFLGCATTAFRSLRQGDNTGVDLVCSYRKEPSSPDLDRVGLYHEVSNKTRAVTRLGPYSLDRTSLYVNGYNEQPVTRPVTPTPTRPPTTPPGLERFTVNFTITNLPYDSDLHVPHSAKLNSTQRVMTTLLNRLLKDTSIGPNFLGCATTAFRSLRQGDNTGVDLVCSYRKEPSSPDLDRVGLYHEVSNKTRAVTRLGPYSLDRTSLYVNGYNEQPVTRPVTPTPTRPPTTPPGLERFTVNFTITNLPYDSDLHVPHSAKLNSTQRVMTTLLNRLLKDTSIGPNFLGCATTAFRSLRQGDNTGVDLVCSYRKEPSSPDLDRVGLYHEVSNKTRAVTRLGPYSLDRTSLYVNGYNEQPVTRPVTPTPTRPPTTPPGLERFTVNFTITNLPYDSDLHVPHSAKLNSTQRVMTTLLNRLLKDTSIGPNFLGCATTAFRSLRQGDNTGVDLVCSYRKEPSSPDLDRVGLYHEVSNKTRAVTRLGPYSLDRTSLYVNGYNEQPVTRPVTPTPTRPPTTPPGLERFTVNFTITNLPYDSDLHVPHSAKLNSTQRVMTTLLNRLLKDTSIGPNFLGCATTAFRSLRQGDNTGVDLVCSYRKEPSSPDLDRVGLYHEVSNKTRAVTRLGPYSLDRTSLYVNGYNEQPVTRPVTPTPTRPPTTPPGLERFTVNFTITNLPYDSDLHVPHSAKLNSTQRVMTTLLNRLLKDTSIGPNFLGCATTAFRSLRQGDNTGVDLVCSYRKEPSSPDLDRVGLYHEVSNKTRAVTRLGPYSLDRTSLYVNGYNEQPVTRPVTPTPTRPPTTPPGLERFTVNFTITNLPYDSDLHVPHSAKLNSTQRVMTTLLNRLLKDTSIGPNFLGCATTAFRSLRQGDNTGVDLVCSYRKEPSSPDLDRVGLYHEVSNKTRAVTRLGPYSLDRTSLYVNDYNEPHDLSLEKPFNTQSLGQIIQQFTVNFTITNLKFTTDLGRSHSAIFNSTKKIMQHYIDPLLRKSSIGPDFIGCKAILFRSVTNRNSTAVDSICSYRNGSQVPNFDKAAVYQELRTMTINITKLGIYKLDKESLYVNGYNEPLQRSHLRVTTAPSPTTSHFTLNFTLTNFQYTADLDAPNSQRFISTEKVIKHYIDPLFKRSSISSVYTGCKVMRFRSGRRRGDTGVDAVCSYKNNVSMARFDRETVYHELSTMTNGITKLGHYSLEKNSLHVNGFHLTDTATTRKPVLNKAPAITGYKLSFRIVNENLTNPDSQSPEYKAALESISKKLNQLYHQSNLQDQFLNCSITRLRAGSIVVDCNCFFQQEPSINRAVVERAFQNGTSNTTGLWLGSSYQLQEFSVDGLELAIQAATDKTPLRSEKESFRLKFRITNLPYSPELQDSRSQMYQENKEKIEKELNVFRNSSMKNYFAGCTVESFGPVHGKPYTSITSVCKFTHDPFLRTLQKQEVYEELQRLTDGFTKLGPTYELDEQSLVVEDYSSLSTAEQDSKRSELQFWAIILICVFALLGFILLLLLCFLIVFCLRRKSDLYQVQQGMYGVFFPHLGTKIH